MPVIEATVNKRKEDTARAKWLYLQTEMVIKLAAVGTGTLILTTITRGVDLPEPRNSKQDNFFVQYALALDTQGYIITYSYRS